MRHTHPDLLPTNASGLEIALARTCSMVTDYTVDFSRLWDPYECPEQFLPALAWSLNVDLWDDTWTIPTKRAICAAAVGNHFIKGTRVAVADALSALDIKADIIEWHEEAPQAPPGTFKIRLFVGGAVDDAQNILIFDDRIAQAQTLIDRVKRLSQHYTSEIGVQAEIQHGIALAQHATTYFIQRGDL